MGYYLKRDHVSLYKDYLEAIRLNVDSGEVTTLQYSDPEEMQRAQYLWHKILKAAEAFPDMFEGRYVNLRKLVKVKANIAESKLEITPKDSLPYAKVETRLLETASSWIADLVERKPQRIEKVVALGSLKEENVRAGLEAMGYEVERLSETSNGMLTIKARLRESQRPSSDDPFAPENIGAPVESPKQTIADLEAEVLKDFEDAGVGEAEDFFKRFREGDG